MKGIANTTTTQPTAESLESAVNKVSYQANDILNRLRQIERSLTGGTPESEPNSGESINPAFHFARMQHALSDTMRAQMGADHILARLEEALGISTGAKLSAAQGMGNMQNAGALMGGASLGSLNPDARVYRG